MLISQRLNVFICFWFWHRPTLPKKTSNRPTLCTLYRCYNGYDCRINTKKAKKMTQNEEKWINGQIWNGKNWKITLTPPVHIIISKWGEAGQSMSKKINQQTRAWDTETAIQSSWKMTCIIIKLTFWITCMDKCWTNVKW